MAYDFWSAAKVRPTSPVGGRKDMEDGSEGGVHAIVLQAGGCRPFRNVIDGGYCSQLAGIFGWSGTPAAFQVVTRAITWDSDMPFEVHVVDDIIGVCIFR